METTPVIADTGFVVALLNRLDARHSEVATVYAQQQQILLPQTVLAEVAYLLTVCGRKHSNCFFARTTC